MITSVSNDRVKLVRALQSRKRTREQEGRLVFEGLRLVEEVVQAGVAPDFALVTEALAADRRGGQVLEALQRVGAPVYSVTEAVMAACSDTQTPQGVLIVLPIPELPLPVAPTLSLVVDGVHDPGNLGTILRTAWAAGVEQVLLAPGTVDVASPKVVRSAMGAHLHLPLRACAWDDISAAVSHCDVWLASAAAEVCYTEIDWTRPVALIMGGEAEGAGAQASALAKGCVSIPMAPLVESLNTAVAAAIILFEAVRQRQAHCSHGAG
ncbi:MAG: RNA methyltransferase [Anaerolineales bacterium]|nr:RNA methyltransferase [Anaerolineales bacterium]